MRVISRLKNKFHSQSHAFNYITFILQEPELLSTQNGMKLKHRRQLDTLHTYHQLYSLYHWITKT